MSMHGEIIEAIDSGDLDRLEELFQEENHDEVIDVNYRSHYSKPTYLHMAVWNQYPNVVNFLLEQGADPNLTADYLDLELFRETTPLHIAVKNGSLKLIEILCLHSRTDLDESGSDSDGLSPLQYALSLGELEIAGVLRKNGAKPLELSRPPTSYSDKTLMDILNDEGEYEGVPLVDLLNYDLIEDVNEEDKDNNTLVGKAIIDGDIEQVKLLLQCGAILRDEDYDNANDEILELLNYRPGKDQPTIFEFCNKDTAVSRRKQILLDFEDTTDEESSDEDDVAEQEVEPLTSQEIEVLKQERIQILKQYNKSLNDFIKGDQAVSDKLPVVTFRGMHNDPMYTTAEARRQQRQDLTAKKPTLSYATFKKSGYEADEEIDENTQQVKQAHQEVTNFFTQLKKTKDKNESKQTTRNNIKFENLYYRFIQAYVENYNTLFNQGSISEDFGFDSNHNPALSTSYLPEKAMKYASGMRNKKEAANHRLLPHYRRFTGKPKHPHVGFVDIFAMDMDYIKHHGAHILELIQNDKISISHIKQFECEILFESMIPGKYHIFREIFSFPSFVGDYKDEYLKEYGLTKIMYNRFQKKIKELEEPVNSNGMIEILDDIIGHIVEHKGAELKNKIDALLYQDKKYAVYPFVHRELKEMPVSPNEKEKWKKIRHVDQAELEEAFGDMTLQTQKLFE